MITLGFLSIVALIGLTLLPIADVISCPNDVRWDKPTNTTASFSAFHKYAADEYMGWSVSASLDVSMNGDGYGVSSATASPSIVDPEILRILYENGYTKNSKSYRGNATVKAAVFPYYYNHKYGDPDNYINTPYPATLLLAVAERTTNTYQWLTIWTESDTTEHQVKVEVSAEGSIKGLVKLGGNLGYQYTDTNGKVWSARVGETEVKSEYKAGPSVGKSATFTGESEYGNAWASVSGFDMEGCCFPSERVDIEVGSD